MVTGLALMRASAALLPQGAALVRMRVLDGKPSDERSLGVRVVTALSVLRGGPRPCQASNARLRRYMATTRNRTAKARA